MVYENPKSDTNFIQIGPLLTNLSGKTADWLKNRPKFKMAAKNLFTCDLMMPKFPTHYITLLLYESKNSAL